MSSALKFAANLNFLFTEGTPALADKVKLAAQAGFRAIEIPYPIANSEIDVIAAKKETGIEVALVNIALGETDELKLGAASIPKAEETFQEHLKKTINFAKAVKCWKIHIMSGIKTANSFTEQLNTYKCNLKYAAEILEKENIIGVIEPINSYSLPNYFMNSYVTASKVLREINSANLKLMVDVFHLQQIQGNITNTFKEMSDIIGHIQIAQVPHRNEPNVIGELNFEYIFALIEQSSYDNWIGCEYKPKTTTIDGLKWVNGFGYKL